MRGWDCHCTGEVAVAELTERTQAAIAAALDSDREPPRWKRFVGAQIESRVWLEWHRSRGTCPRCQPGRKITPDLKTQVLSRYGRVCGICGEPIGKGEPMHIDHVLPVAKGGRTILENLQPAHPACNLRKGARV